MSQDTNPTPPTIESILKDLVAVADIVGKQPASATWLEVAASVLEIAARDLRLHADLVHS